MKIWKMAGALLIAAASVVGCDKGEDKTPATPPPAPKAESAMDKMNNAMSTATDTAKTKAAEASQAMKEGAATAQEKAVDLKDATVAKGVEAKDSAASTAADAKASLVATAQEYYDKAKSYITSNNLTSAQDMITKLDGIKTQLPAEWGTKIDDLKALYEKAKAGVGNLIPKTGN